MKIHKTHSPHSFLKILHKRVAVPYEENKRVREGESEREGERERETERLN